MIKKDYAFTKGLKEVTLDNLYNNTAASKAILKEDIVEIVRVEAPITINVLKQRLREEVFKVGKISQKALDIINECIYELKLTITNNYYDEVLWPREGTFNINYVRMYEGRQIYDVAYQEMANVVNSTDAKAEELYRYILGFFGYEVLTKKAADFLEFIEKKCR